MNLVEEIPLEWLREVRDACDAWLALHQTAKGMTFKERMHFEAVAAKQVKNRLGKQSRNQQHTGRELR